MAVWLQQFWYRLILQFDRKNSQMTPTSSPGLILPFISKSDFLRKDCLFRNQNFNIKNSISPGDEVGGGTNPPKTNFLITAERQNV